MIDKKVILERIDVLKQQREQAITTIHMIDGALQVLDGLLAEAANPESTTPEPEKSDLASVG